MYQWGRSFRRSCERGGEIKWDTTQERRSDDRRGVSVGWYCTSFAANISTLDFELGGEEMVQLALQVLELDGWERILDLACATGDRTLERAARALT